MPQWRIVTNLPKEAIPKDFVKEASETLQKAINKPMQVCGCSLEHQEFVGGVCVCVCVCVHTLDPEPMKVGYKSPENGCGSIQEMGVVLTGGVTIK